MCYLNVLVCIVWPNGNDVSNCLNKLSLSLSWECFLLSHILFSQELNWIIHIANPLKYATYFNLLDLEIYVNDCKEVHCFFGVVVVVVIVVVVV